MPEALLFDRRKMASSTSAVSVSHGSPFGRCVIEKEENLGEGSWSGSAGA